MKSPIRRVGALAATAALAFTLVSCSGGGQSVEDACKIAEESLTSATTEMQSSLQSTVTDAMSGGDVDLARAFDPLTKALKDTQGKISNKDVKDALGKAVEGFEEYIDIFKGIDFTDPAAMADMQAKVTEGTNAVTTAGEDLTKLCGV